MTVSSEPQLSDGDRHRLKTFHREFLPAFVVYLITVAVTSALVGDDAGMPRQLLLFLPLLPALWQVRAVVRSLQRADELERIMQLEAMAVGFGAALVTAMTVGFLGNGSDPNRFNQKSPWIIFMAAALAWGATSAIRAIRHR